MRLVPTSPLAPAEGHPAHEGRADGHAHAGGAEEGHQRRRVHRVIKYQDRVLYGTDLDLLATADVAEALKDWEATYARDWRFLATDESFESEGRKIQGLKLPEAVLHKIFRDNARHWVPGL